jgi:hypothetical protein
MNDPARRLRRLSPGARADLLRVLTSPSNVRADVVRQFHERGKDLMVETLAELEADELLREQVVALLRGSTGEAVELG